MPSSLISLAKDIMRVEQGTQLLALYKKDNKGYLYLKEFAPHLVSQLDSLTMEWTMVPKLFVMDLASLESMLDTYRENLKYSELTPNLVPLPKGVDFPLFKKKMETLLEFLENEVKPVLQNMPIDAEEVEDDVATEFIEDDFTGDESGDGGEGAEETGNTEESASDGLRAGN